jgi:plasmid replication initiation protein
MHVVDFIAVIDCRLARQTCDRQSIKWGRETMTLRKASDDDEQLEMFTAMFTDIATRDIQDAMEMPFLNLAKQPRFEPIRYRSKEVSVTVSGGKPYGIANIWDWDLMLWLFSQIRQALDNGDSPSRHIRFHRHAFLKDARRADGGAQYKRLEETIARLKNTTVVTTLRAQSRRTVMFSWIEHAIVERDYRNRLAHAVVVLPEWLYDSVGNNKLVLTLHRDYFRLTGGLERWLYRLVRKSAGHQKAGWTWKLRTLHQRSGSPQELKYFARAIRQIVARSPLLDYELSLGSMNGDECLHAKKVGATSEAHVLVARRSESADFLRLNLDTYERAKRVAPGYDVHFLETQWRKACERSGEHIRNADAAYVGYCRKVATESPARRAS